MILDKLKAYGAIVLALVLGVLLLVQTNKLHNSEMSLAQAKVEHAKTLKDIAELTAKAAQAVQHQSDLWAVAQEKNVNETLEKLSRANTDRNNAVLTSTRLQERVSALVSEARRASQNPSIKSSVEATEDPIGVLAELRSRADERAGILAEYGDKARIAGESCERDYNALRATGVPLEQ